MGGTILNLLNWFSVHAGSSDVSQLPNFNAGAGRDVSHGEHGTYSEEDGEIVMKYHQTICQTAGKGRVPTVSDLPCPPHRIHMALTRAAKQDGVPPHIRRIAQSALGSLVLFE